MRGEGWERVNSEKRRGEKGCFRFGRQYRKQKIKLKYGLYVCIMLRGFILKRPLRSGIRNRRLHKAMATARSSSGVFSTVRSENARQEKESRDRRWEGTNIITQ